MDKEKQNIVYGTKLFAGQPLLYMDCAKKAGFSAECYTYKANRFGYKVDQTLDMSLRSRRSLFNEILERKPHAVHFWQTGILSPYVGDPSIISEYESYLKAGIHVFHRFTGFDLRLPVCDDPLLGNAVFAEHDWPFAHHINLPNYRRHLMNLLSISEVKFCVGDSELGKLLNKYTLTPRLFSRPVLAEQTRCQDQSFVIVHAPSNGSVKGTKFVDAAIQDLKARGHDVKYIKLQNMPHEKVLEKIANADLVIDQLLIGAPGVLTLEGWSMAKPVACFFDEDVLADYPQCPVLNVRPDNIFHVLESVVKDQQRLKIIANNGRLAFEQFHAIKPNVKFLRELYNGDVEELNGDLLIKKQNRDYFPFRIREGCEACLDRSLPSRFVTLTLRIFYAKLLRIVKNLFGLLRSRLRLLHAKFLRIAKKLFGLLKSRLGYLISKL